MAPQTVIGPHHPLFGACTKVERARQHLDELDREISEFRAQETHRVTKRTDGERTIVRVEIVLAPNDVLWGVIVGEIVHNLRSTLEHVVYQLALLTDPDPGTTTSFPIHKTESARSSAHIASTLAKVPDPAREYIVSLQPYQWGDKANDHPLCVLHELWNRDKHRLINHTPFGIEFKAPKDPRIVLSHGNGAAWELSMPTELAEELDFAPDVSTDVTFERDGPGVGADVSALRRVHDLISDKMLPQFAEFFPQPSD